MPPNAKVPKLDVQDSEIVAILHHERWVHHNKNNDEDKASKPPSLIEGC